MCPCSFSRHRGRQTARFANAGGGYDKDVTVPASTVRSRNLHQTGTTQTRSLSSGVCLARHVEEGHVQEGLVEEGLVEEGTARRRIQESGRQKANEAELEVWQEAIVFDTRREVVYWIDLGTNRLGAVL